MSANISVSLAISDVSAAADNAVPAKRIKFEITLASGISNKLFLVRNRGALVEFVTVCGASDLDNFPADAPLADAEDPLYRTSSFELVTDQPSMLTLVEAGIDRRIKQLISALDQLSVYTTTRTLSYSSAS